MGGLRRRLGLLLPPALVVLTIAVTIAPAPAHAAVTPPQSDPFYTAPAGFAAAPPGTVFRSRQVMVSFGPAPVTGPAYTAYQLLYRTNSATGQPLANVTTVIVPSGSPPAGGRKLVSVQDAEDSLDPDCAPSYQLQVGENAPNGDHNGNLAAESSLATAELAAGYDVVIPDAEGPDSEYLADAMEGHAVLDSIRAVERFSAADLDGSKTPVAIIGYSGGASDSAAANELAPSYAPELQIVAVAAGGVPAGNYENFEYLNGSLGAGTLMAVSIGIDRAYPALNLYSYLNAAGQAFAKQASTGCASAIFAAPYTNFNSWTTQPNVFLRPSIQQVIAENALGHAAPAAPTFYFNVIHDELVWIKPLDQLVAYYCAHGARIDYFRDPVTQEHIQGLQDFVPLAEAYLSQRFAGDSVPDTCGAPANAGPPPGRPAPAGCPQATGRLRDGRLGMLRLGMTRAQARGAYRRSAGRRARFEDFFCLTPIGLRVGYASPRLLRGLPPRERPSVRGRVVWASTANGFYSLRGVRPGMRLALVAARLHAGRPFHIGLNWWYFAPGARASGLLKVRHGIVEEVGIADAALTHGRRAQRAFLESFG